jgi:hypothetical protein
MEPLKRLLSWLNLIADFFIAGINVAIAIFLIFSWLSACWILRAITLFVTPPGFKQAILFAPFWAILFSRFHSDPPGSLSRAYQSILRVMYITVARTIKRPMLPIIKA